MQNEESKKNYTRVIRWPGRPLTEPQAKIETS